MQSLRKTMLKTFLNKSVSPAFAQFQMSTFNYEVKARVAHPAPHFEGMAWDVKDFKKVSLTDFKNKYVVLFFYPLDFTFVCPTEIIEFSDKAEHFRKTGKTHFLDQCSCRC